MEAREKTETHSHGCGRVVYYSFDDLPDSSDKNDSGEDLGSLRHIGDLEGEKWPVRYLLLR